MALKLKPIEIVALTLMLIPGLAIIGAFIYFFACGLPNGLKLVMFILAAIFGTVFTIILWLDAFGVITIG